MYPQKQQSLLCDKNVGPMQRYMISIKLHTYMAPIVYVVSSTLLLFENRSVELGQGTLIPRLTPPPPNIIKAGPDLCKKRSGSETLDVGR